MLAETFAQDPMSNTDTVQIYQGHNASVKTLVLVEHETQQTFSLNIAQNSETIIGRTDRLINYAPSLDLALFGGYRLGVSRLHAEIMNDKGVISVVDLNSANGTSINDMPLEVNKSYRLQCGDILQLGSFILEIVSM